jgi:CelD/BcsL family acetyltransferase involved in cellulose biosynthesis
VESPQGNIAGVVPARAGDSVLNYAIGSFPMAKARMRLVSFLGYEPIVPDDERLFVEMVRTFLGAFPDCDGIDLGWVTSGGNCWKMTLKSRELRRDVLVYAPKKLQTCHYIDLPDSYDQYMAKFSAKRRSELRRQNRRLREHGGGRLECVRIENESDVPYLLVAGSKIAVQSRVYQNTGWNVLENSDEMSQKLVECARRGVLRCYLLRCGDEPCAFLKGFQYYETFHSTFIGFDARFAQFSPGMMLHCMVIEDLCAVRPPKRMNLGAGQWPYLNDLKAETVTGTSVMLLRGTLRNRLRVVSHSALRSSVGVARRILPKAWRKRNLARDSKIPRG